MTSDWTREELGWYWPTGGRVHPKVPSDYDGYGEDVFWEEAGDDDSWVVHELQRYWHEDFDDMYYEEDYDEIESRHRSDLDFPWHIDEEFVDEEDEMSPQCDLFNLHWNYSSAEQDWEEIPEDDSDVDENEHEAKTGSPEGAMDEEWWNALLSEPEPFPRGCACGEIGWLVDDDSTGSSHVAELTAHVAYPTEPDESSTGSRREFLLDGLLSHLFTSLATFLAPLPTVTVTLGFDLAVVSHDPIRSLFVAICARSGEISAARSTLSLAGAVLAVLVVSTEERAYELRQRVQRLRAQGVSTLWLVWPHERMVTVIQHDRPPLDFGCGVAIPLMLADQTLDIPVRSLFPA